MTRLPLIGEHAILIKSEGCNEGDEGYISTGKLVDFYEDCGFYHFIVKMDTNLYYHVDVTYYEIIEDLLYVHLTSGSYETSEDCEIMNLKWTKL